MADTVYIYIFKKKKKKKNSFLKLFKFPCLVIPNIKHFFILFFNLNLVESEKEF